MVRCCSKIFMNLLHKPVLLQQVLAAVPPQAEHLFDFTLGLGGHSFAILERFPKMRLWGFDRDQAALELARQKLETFASRVQLFAFDFLTALDFLVAEGIKGDFLLADLGFSSFQMDQPERGFSFAQQGPLDMRMDQRQALSLEGFLKKTDAQELAWVLKTYGEEVFAKRIARNVIEARDAHQLENTKDLADVIERAVPTLRNKKIHKATLSFQALRIHINRELYFVEHFLQALPSVVKPGSRVMMISFHSLEDRLVKKQFQLWQKPCTCPSSFPVCICHKKPVAFSWLKKPLVANADEIFDNKRARSARLRGVEFV